MSHFRAPFEWEQLDKPVALPGRSLEKIGPSLNEIPETVELNRDADYRLKVRLTGRAVHGTRELANFTTKSGQTIKGDTLVFNPFPFEKYTLNSMIPMSVNHRGDGEYVIEAHIGSVIIERGDQEPHTFIVHALNCPNVEFPDSTAWDDSGDTSIRIGRSREQAHEGFEYKYGNHGGGMSYNCLLLQNKYGTVIFSKVDQKELRKHKPCSIHFMDSESAANQALRKKWMHAIGYFLGSRLIPVAESLLSAQGIACHQKCFSPHLMKDFNEPSMPPCRALDQQGFSLDATKLGKQIEKFIDNYDLFNLDTVVWNLWFGRAMPQGLNLTGYSASLEALSKAWCKHTTNISAKNYVDQATFQKLIAPILDDVREKAKVTPDWKKVENKLKDANLLSIHQRIGSLFSGLNLNTTSVEKKVLGARHKLVHGAGVSETDINFVIKAARAYEVIINRCVLASIQASDTYIDYSTHEFPQRNLGESLGGSDL